MKYSKNIMRLVVSILFASYLITACAPKRIEELSVEQLTKIDQIVRGLIEADIIFPFKSAEDIPLLFYSNYLSIRYKDSEIPLDNEMRTNLDYSQVFSTLKSDWEIDEIPLTGFSGSKAEFQITIQKGLQGKQYTIYEVVVKDGYAFAQVSIERELDLINREVAHAKSYVQKIDYKFKLLKEDVKLTSSSYHT